MLQTFEYIPRNGIYYAQAFALIDNMPEEQRLFFTQAMTIVLTL